MTSMFIEQYTIGERGVLVADENNTVIIFPRETIANIKIHREGGKLNLEIKETTGDINRFVLTESNLKQTDIDLLKKVFVL